ncbi:MAG: lipoyl synthase [Candidatus Omnitrophica bacterium]|nr:lipoyl synthase [Candidatus Omnitrophota bacterium]
MRRFPDWLRRQLPVSSSQKTWHILGKYGLNTVCESALCPNRSECYSQKTATFMILGDRCTRRCGFCAVETGLGEVVEADEPERLARAAEELGLRYVVVTSVARDDLVDEGAEHFYRCVTAIKDRIEGVEVEVLTPDFHAREELIRRICEANPTVYNHNIETVERLQRLARPQAKYDRSLKVLSLVKQLFPHILTKSGLMLGLGETEDEVISAACDLREVGCEILTLGQYLSPSEEHLKVKEFIPPEVFRRLADTLRQMGFREVYAGPYIRSSYHAAETLDAAREEMTLEKVNEG